MLWIILIIIAAVIAGFSIGLYAIYGMVFRGIQGESIPGGTFGDGRFDKEIHDLTDEMKRRPFEEILIKSYDGKRLRAKLYRGKAGAPVDICCHGYRGLGVRDYCAMGKYLIEKGDNVILIDHRAHGYSGGRTICYGIRERRDVQKWAYKVAEMFGDETDIYLYGISMGAATVLMTSSLKLPKNVRAILADCPYSSPKKIIKSVVRGMKLPVNLVYPLIWLSGVVYGGLRIPPHFCAANEVKNTSLPILIIHGADDTFVPASMSEEVAKANPELIERHTIEGADHGLSYMVDRERYIQIVEEFLERVKK
ncbi:MAG: alpha/beta hydrolase [Ruminococcus sp.]|nr:alpha/beta hydrolase [Ruminococcus sp.]